MNNHHSKTMNIHILSFLAVVLTCSLTSVVTERATLTLDVKQCGAVGDGVTHDTAAIQKALAGGQRVVIIPPGTYKVSAALKVASGTTIQADPKAIIRLADGAGANAGVFIITNRDPAGGNSNITFEGGIWDGNNEHNPFGREGDPNGYTCTAINFVNVHHLELRNLTIRKLDGGNLAKWSNQAPFIPIQSVVHGLRIENFRREPADDQPAPMLVVDNGQQNRLNLESATGESAGNKFVLPGGGFALLCLDTPDKGNSPTAEYGEVVKSFRDNESEETLKQNLTNFKK
jgi:hypothetical protein